MKSHQRYFSVVDAGGKLMPKFIAVSNTPVDEKLSIRGYENVLKSRLADGRFFFDQDRQVKLADRVPKLARVVFQGKLGTYAEKVNRITSLATWLANAVGYRDLPALERAALLAKADLVTGMVGEFPELQGVMGREYARASGEPEEVALAVFEHYLPRSATDGLPTRDAGALLGLADRLDTLCGIFGIGKPPTGAADPFGLRRACLAIINVLLGRGYRFSLSGAVDEAFRLLSAKLNDVKRKPAEAPLAAQVMDFFRGRLKALWADKHRADVVEAVLCAGFDDLVGTRARLEALSRQVAGADFAPLATAFKRVANIVDKQGRDVGKGEPDPAKFTDPAERALHASFLASRTRVAEHVKGDDYAGALREIIQLKPAVDTFFDKVMVMAEDKAQRENRVRLLTEVSSLFGQVADFSKLQGET
jgi:glycyl-tRNA synthetase beta chain